MLSNLYLNSASDNPYIAAGIITMNLSLYVQAFFNQRFWPANLSVFVYWLVVSGPVFKIWIDWNSYFLAIPFGADGHIA